MRYVRITDLDDDGNLKSDDVVSPEVVDETLLLREGDILIARSGSVGRTYIHRLCEGKYQFAGYLLRYRVDPTKALPLFVYQVTKSEMWAAWVIRQSKTGTLTNINAQQYKTFEFPLPPLDIQRQMVAELDGYRKVIEGARQVLANYKPTIRIDPEWPRVRLGEVCRIVAPLVDPKLPQFRSLPHVSGENIESGTGALFTLRSAAEDKVISGKYAFKAGAVLYSKLRPYLCKAALAASDGLCSADMYPLVVEDSQVDARFLLNVLLSGHFTRYAVELSGRARMPKLNREDLMSYEIPLPPLDIQREIVAEIEAERALVEANRKLVEVFEKKIQAKLAEIWGEENSRKKSQEAQA